MKFKMYKCTRLDQSNLSCVHATQTCLRRWQEKRDECVSLKSNLNSYIDFTGSYLHSVNFSLKV